MTGHAAPASDGSSPTSPDNLAAEVDRLEVFCGAVLARRQ